MIAIRKILKNKCRKHEHVHVTCSSKVIQNVNVEKTRLFTMSIEEMSVERFTFPAETSLTVYRQSPAILGGDTVSFNIAILSTLFFLLSKTVRSNLIQFSLCASPTGKFGGWTKSETGEIFICSSSEVQVGHFYLICFVCPCA